MNIAYKHLDAKLRIADLSVGQWIGISLGIALGTVWGLYLSPFGPMTTLASAIYLGMLPAGSALLGNLTSVSPWLLLRSALGWRRRDGRFLPGPGEEAHGYLVERPADTSADDTAGANDLRDLSSLWETTR